MANTAPKVAEVERQESPDVLDRKADALTELIRKSKHFIVCTGAGVSTSAGISDFRGPNGAWTLRAQGKQALNKKSTLQAIPTPTHMALVEMQNRGILTHLISQNCDGLHRKSGILPEKISELHGNSNREYCQDCGKEYIRDFRAVSTYEKSIHDHRTGRKCALCGGVLLDTIINFGEGLNPETLQQAFTKAKKADLCLVLGSSLTVGRRKGGKLVICNLQSTPIDHLADIRIFAKVDDIITRVMTRLELPIPWFILRRRLVIQIETTVDKRQQLVVKGVDVDGTPATFLQSVRLDYNRRTAQSEPFLINFRTTPEPGAQLKLELEFMGRYGEPNLEVTYDYPSGGDAESHYLLEYDPNNGRWESTQIEKPLVDRADGRLVVDLTTDD
ncbi:NAD-dependent deacetylase sirtuin-7 [Poronia punctata]|nr:NAD-dependent deacetylase sirtuin-7 [Poronia punctata]